MELQNNVANNIISRKTWEQAANADTKLNLLFDLLEDTNHRVKRLERRKWVNTAGSVAGGFTGGFMAILSKMAIWK